MLFVIYISNAEEKKNNIKKILNELFDNEIYNKKKK
jgi:hypothetical protein